MASHDKIAAAVARLRSGGLVAFPTETVYGLGAAAREPPAGRRIYAAKGRPAGHPPTLPPGRDGAGAGLTGGRLAGLARRLLRDIRRAASTDIRV